MGTPDYAASLKATVGTWPNVSALPHRFGGVEFRVERRELGHVHLNGMLDIPFPSRMRRDLVAAGRAQAHHMLPNTGWVTFRIRSENDLPAAVELLRLNYDRLTGIGARITPSPILATPTLVRDRDHRDLPT